MKMLRRESNANLALFSCGRVTMPFNFSINLNIASTSIIFQASLARKSFYYKSFGKNVPTTEQILTIWGY